MAMCGYFNRPELNASRIRHGWHCTRDLGRYNMDGSIEKNKTGAVDRDRMDELYGGRRLSKNVSGLYLT